MPKERNNRYAVVVGISHSEATGGRVQVNGDNTARLMVSILRDAGWSRKNIKLLTNRQATKQAVLDNIDWLKSVEDEDSTVVVFFACHGNATGVKVWDAMLSHRAIRDYLSSLRSQKQLVVVATCQSGGAVEPGFDGITLGEPHRIVVASCGERVVDPCTHRYTRWAERFLLNGMKRGKADVNGDGLVSIQEAHEYGGGKMSDNYGQEFFL